MGEFNKCPKEEKREEAALGDGAILRRILDILQGPKGPASPPQVPPAQPGPLDDRPVLKRIAEIGLYILLAFLAMKFGITPKLEVDSEKPVKVMMVSEPRPEHPTK